MHAKTEWDVTSLTPSSSPASPKRPVYYVQSPSRDSHDDADKSSASTQTAPAYASSSPMESPSHPSTYGRSSNPRSSSASRVSGNWRWSRGNRKRSGKEWHQCKVIEEEVDYDDMYGDAWDAKRSYCLVPLMGFAVVFAGFCLIIWGASRPYTAQIRVKSMKVDNFYFGEGSDRTGVPTKLLTVNCTATMWIHNPARFFGIYIRSNQVDVMYSQVTVATGQLKKFFQPRSSSRVMSVKLEGRRIPLYGAGATLAASDESGGVPLTLDFQVHSRGYLVGRLVKTKHQRHVSCSFIVNSKGTNQIKFHPDSCIYD